MSNSQTALQTLLKKGVSRIIDEASLKEKLESGKKLRVKFGIDPSGPIVHIGHMVPILKLRAFQELGHQIVLIIGDSTAQVGDTSDKDAERPMLEREQTRENARNWLNLFGKVLDIPKVELHYNSEWMDTTSFNTVGELAKNFSVAEMLDRENFSKRYKAGQRISLQEFLYPIMQGWDSVQVRADVEIGGNDQYFNLLAGRPIQAACGQAKQDIMTFELLLGPDGQKMSKTKGNTIPVDLDPKQMFMRVMEVKDEYILDYFRLATTISLEEVAGFENRLKSGEHPKEIKFDLAKTIVTLYHGAQAAEEGRAYFEKVLSEGIIPSENEMEHVTLDTTEIGILTLLKEIGFANTTGDARNMVWGNGIRIDGETISDTASMISLDSKKGLVVQSGKKKFKLVFGK